MRVLIADDQKGVGDALAALVKECGHEVVGVVTSGFDAIQAYNRQRPDVVLMDYNMLRLNGATACRNILARNPAARIILVTGACTAEDLAGSGAVAVLAKPVNLSDLSGLLNAQSAPAEGVPVG